MPRNRLIDAAMIAILLAGGVGVSAPTASAADVESDQQQPAFPDLEAEGWLLHGQTTYIVQGHPKFKSPYAGQNSMTNDTRFRGGVSAGPVLGRKLWSGAEFVINPEMDVGSGLSDSVGVAGFPNNEAFRAGSTYPKFTIPRLYLKQVIGFGGAEEDIAADQLQFAEKQDVHRLTVWAGKFSVWDVFDDNKYAHDARLQFMNWVLVGNGAIDFAADARGYTDGVALDYNREGWAARLGYVQVSKDVNAKRLDDHVLDGWQILGELEQRYTLFGRAGKLRELGMVDRTRSITYQPAYGTAGPVNATDPLPGFRRYRPNYGFGLNAEQALTDDLGLFARLGWNPGHVQEFMFTEVDRHVSVGLSLKGTAWDRGDDTVGVAVAVNGLSDRHRSFYAAGNTGFIVGDGRLRYRPEEIAELYYQLEVVKGVQLTADYQLVVNPGYNADRGPISILGFRAHAQF